MRAAAADSVDHVEAVAGLDGRVDDLGDDDDAGVAMPGQVDGVCRYPL